MTSVTRTFAREMAEARKVRAKLSLQNASVHTDNVRERFGLMSPEFLVARKVREDARAELIKAFDALLDLDRGVPAERVS